MMSRVPEAQRGFLFRLTEKIMPRTAIETVMFIALACTAGMSEEFLYRGFVFAVFKRMFLDVAFPVQIAAVLSSGWFAIGHLYQGKRGVITTFIVGILFCASRYWSGNLMPPMVAHMGIDLMAGLYAARLFRHH
jgi:uncharacterized protein